MPWVFVRQTFYIVPRSPASGWFVCSGEASISDGISSSTAVASWVWQHTNIRLNTEQELRKVQRQCWCFNQTASSRDTCMHSCTCWSDRFDGKKEFHTCKCTEDQELDIARPSIVTFTMQSWTERNPWEELFPYWTRRLELAVEDGCLLWDNRVVVPPPSRNDILQELHEAHPGVVRMKLLARSYVWWPSINQDIENTVRQCQQCQLN